jgi:phospholipase/carboxylesterase
MADATRRSLPAMFAGLFVGSGCRGWTATPVTRLRARPGKPGKTPKPGSHPLNLRPQRDAVLYVPESLPPDRPAPLVVFLHGAGGNEQRGLLFLSAYADEFGFLLLVPASGDDTWDAIRDTYGPDVRFLDRALEQAFQMCQVDPTRIAVSGFSDGASYALGLGMSNGDLFGSVMAFSPGFVPNGAQPNGKPRFFVSHGTADRILPIEQCSRSLVPRLTRAGYQVTYREFDGPHTLPREIGGAAMRWFLS